MSKRWFVTWHRRLAWVGGFVVLCWAVSGISHPVMAWFGPQAVKMFPPSARFSADALNALPAVLKANDVKEARVLKVVPTAESTLLQLTDSDTQPRRYFNLLSGAEQHGFDEQQARWLASYYTGRSTSDIESVEFVTAHSLEYPAVNRLLPVYRVQYRGTDALTAFVHTETAALASLNNRSKANIQTVFQQLHTWAWLEVTGHGRVLLIGLFMLTLFLMAAGGLSLLLLLKQRAIADARRRWHRLLGYLVFLPLLGWSASGFYHLLQSQYLEPVSGLRLGSAFSVEALAALEADLPAAPLTALSIVPGPEGRLYYRAALAVDDEAVSRSARFQGRGVEKGALYFDAARGESAGISDADVVQALVKQWRGDVAVLSTEKLHRFGPDYDFRNKRLPVWQVSLDDAESRQLFLDPATGVLVDQSREIDRVERWVFSIFHKWNHLTGITGREGRDGLIVVILLLAILASALGMAMLVARRGAKSV